MLQNAEKLAEHLKAKESQIMVQDSGVSQKARPNRGMMQTIEIAIGKRWSRKRESNS